MKHCFLCNAILEKVWEMTRNLSAHPALLLNPTISEFCHHSHMVITFYNLNILLSLLLLSHPTVSKLYQPTVGIFFGLVIPLNFLEIGRNYVSIIITNISNITVLCHTVLFTLDILCVRAMVSIRRVLQLSPPSLSFTRFSSGLLVVWQEIVYQSSFAHVDTSSFAQKTNLSSLKTEDDKLDIDKLDQIITKNKAFLK